MKLPTFYDKPREYLYFIAFLFAVITIAGIFFIPVAKAESAPQATPAQVKENQLRLQFQANEYGISIFCDNATGNLIYRSAPLGGIQSSMPLAVVPGGCHKNTR